MSNELTDTERRLVEHYIRVLDYVTRVSQAIDGGNWHYLWDKSDDLMRVSDDLAKLTDEIWSEVKEGGIKPRGDVVKAEVAFHGRHYRAGRLLHPLEGG